MPSTSNVIGELSIEESEALKALLSLGSCVISETGGLVINPSTVLTTILEPQNIPVEEQLQMEGACSSKNIRSGPSTITPCTSTSVEEPKKQGALSGEQILDFLNNQPKIILKCCHIPKKDKHSVRSETGIFPTHKTAAQYKLRIQTHHLKRKRKQKYYFKCAIPNCNRTYNSVKEWNITTWPNIKQ